MGDSWNYISHVESEGDLPLNDVFAELSELYRKRNPASTNSSLANHLGIRAQSCSQWKTGTDGRRPTWSAILKLCGELNMQVVVDDEGVWLKRRRKKKTRHLDQQV